MTEQTVFDDDNNRNATRRMLLNRRQFLVGGAALLAGCAGSAPALDTHVLSAPPVAPSPRRGKVQILVAEPKALKLFDTENIVVRTGATSIEYLGGAQWGDRLPKTVQTALGEALQDAGFAGGVGVPGQGLAIDYQLLVEIRDFSVSVSGTDSATVALYVQLLNDRSGNVIARDAFSANVAAGSAPDGYVAALNAAFGQVASAIVDWTANRV